jgi:hypothetical protein
MSKQDPGLGVQAEPSSQASGEHAPAAVDRSRRRLFQGAAGGAGVVLSVSSRSAVAGWGTCTGSELASGNLSRLDDANPCGCSPGFWWNSNGRALWQSAPVLAINFPYATATFNSVFGVTFLDPDRKLSELGPGVSPTTTVPGLSGNGGAQTASMHAVAALLNAAYFGARYPVPGLQTAAGVVGAFQTAFLGGRQSLLAFVSRVDIYDAKGTWCNGDPH